MVLVQSANNSKKQLAKAAFCRACFRGPEILKLSPRVKSPQSKGNLKVSCSKWSRRKAGILMWPLCLWWKWAFWLMKWTQRCLRNSQWVWLIAWATGFYPQFPQPNNCLFHVHSLGFPSLVSRVVITHCSLGLDFLVGWGLWCTVSLCCSSAWGSFLHSKGESGLGQTSY